MEALDALLDELNVLAKDLGTDASTNQKSPPSQESSSPSGSTETADTGFDSSSENYNYSTVKRAPPKPPSGRNGSSVTARTNQGEPDLDLTNGLDEIMASLDKLESNSASSNEVTRRTRQVSFKSDQSDTASSVTNQRPVIKPKPAPPTRPRPQIAAKPTPVIKTQPEKSYEGQHGANFSPPVSVSSSSTSSSMGPPPPPNLTNQMPPPSPIKTLGRSPKPPPPATPPRVMNHHPASGNTPRSSFGGQGPTPGHGPSGQGPPGHGPSGHHPFPRQITQMTKQMERTSSYSSDQSDRSSSSGHFPIGQSIQSGHSIGGAPVSPGGYSNRSNDSSHQQRNQQNQQFHHHQQQNHYQHHQYQQQQAVPKSLLATNGPSGYPSSASDHTDRSSIPDKNLIHSANTEKVQIFSAEGSYKWIPIERSMSARYVTQLVAEKHRTRFTAKHSLLEYNPQLATERILEEHEKVVEVVKKWGDNKNELHFFERADKWLLFANPQVLMDRVTAEKQTPREERHRYLEQWYPPNGGFRYPGDENAGPKIAETVYIKEEKKDKWTKKYIEIRKDKLLIFKKESSREKPPEDVLDMKDFLVYRSLDWRKHFKSPLPNGFCVKMGHIQNFGQVKKNSPTDRIKFFAVEDEFSELKWMTALRLVKNGMQLFQNYRQTMTSVDQRPSSLLSLRPQSIGPNMGPLPMNNSRPNSIESRDETDGYGNHTMGGMDSRSYQPNSGNTMILNQPSIPHGVILRDKNLQGHQGHQGHQGQPQFHHNQVNTQGHHQNHIGQHYQGQQSRAPPMTRFYNQEEMMTSPADFPAPPSFVHEIKELSRRINNDQSDQLSFDHLPPPPPELMLQGARHNHQANGYGTISNRPRPPPPSRVRK